MQTTRRGPCRTLAALFCCLAILPATARQLAAVDRLADAPAQSADALARSAQSVASSVQAGVRSAQPRAKDAHVHAQFGVPTFLWAKDRSTGAQSAQGAAANALRATSPAQAARSHLRNLGALYALPGERVDSLPVIYTHRLPNGSALVKFRNRIGGVEVFREEASVLLDPDRQLVAIGGFVMGGDASGAFIATATAAIGVALADWTFDANVLAHLAAIGARDEYEYYELPDGGAGADGSQLKSAVRAKRVLYRLPDQLRPAYYIEVEVADGAQPGDVDRYAYVIDAGDLSVLFRHDQTADASFTYRVFAETTGINLPLPSPSGRNGFPSPTAIPDGYQGPFALTGLVTLQNAPFSRNDPWLPAGATMTTGNNVDAFADLSSPDGFSPGDLRATTTSAGTFDRAFDPLVVPGASNTQIMAAVTNLFYMNNWLHDWYYDAGFDEISGNAQVDNYGRGGLANDSIFAEAQDFNGRNNANMSTPADGARPRMRMYVFDGLQVFQNTVNSPAGISGSKPSSGAAFGPRAYNVTANVVYATPFIGCTAFAPGTFSGAIALIDRGTCTFKTKVLNAQNAGALGVIIANNTTGLTTMGDDTTIAAPITIAPVLFTQADGNLIKAQLPAPGVGVTLQAATSIDRDGTVDNTIVAHEWGHYMSNRLIANSSGLTTNHARGMGEGWADFHSLLLFVKGADSALPNNANFAGTYATGAYVLGSANDPANTAYYYGIRRYPYSRDMTKNPLTFRHIADGVALPVSPVPAFGADGSSNSEVHNTGEVWSSMLWECYSNLLNDTGRLAFDQAQDRMKRYLVAGYKMTPSTPTFTEARDALLAAIAVQDTADYALCYQGFAKRGAGAGAVAPDRFSATNAGVVESFVSGGALSVVAATLSDAPGYCDADGILDNGETGTLSVTIQNTGATPLVATTGSVSSGNAHLTFPGGNVLTIAPTVPGQSVIVTLPVQMSGAVGVETAGITVTLDDPALSTPRPVVANASLWVNADQKANQSATDSVETVHSAWTTGTSSSNPAPTLRWQRIAISGSDHRWIGPDAGVTQVAWLQSPPLNVAASGAFSFTFRHRFKFEFDATNNYDGGQLQISTNGGGGWTSIGASASPAYNGTITAYAGSTNPLAGQAGYVKTSSGYPALQTVTVNLGGTFAGQTVLIRFAAGSDNGGAAAGWEIDDIAFSNITNTPFDALVAHAGACYTVTPQAGTPQAVLVGTAFNTALKALVKDASGTPVAGVTVTFAPPALGASAAFASSATVTTDGAGIATAPALTANATTGSYVVTANAGAQSASFLLKNAVVSTSGIDVDANFGYDALTDGLLLIRYLFGLTGPALTAGAIAPGAHRATPTDVQAYLDSIRGSLDIDANGQVDALTDGLLLVRYLFGLRGSSLIAGAIGGGAMRTSAMDIETYIQSLMP